MYQVLHQILCIHDSINLHKCCKVYVILILKMRELGLREIKLLGQGNIASKKKGWDSNLSLSDV